MLHYAFPTVEQAVSANFLEFREKTFLITGASSGIGRACAARLAREGAQPILTARRRDALKAAAAEAGGGEVIPADLTDAGSIAALCDRILSNRPRVDGIVHSAGVGLYAPSGESRPDEVRRLMDLNFLAPVEITRRLLPQIPDGGAVVTISSVAGKVSLPWLNLYSASKYALNAFSDGLRMELADRRIRVLNVCPCYVETPFQQNVLQGRVPENLPGNAKFKITAEKCAEAVVNGLRSGKRTIVVPRVGWLLVMAARLFPATVHGRMARYKPRPRTESS